MKKRHFEFTDKYLQGKDCRPRDKQFYIRERRGFAIRVLPTGAITFLYIYSINGKRRQMNFGNYPHVSLATARKKYREAASLVADGTDPQGDLYQPPQELTVTDLVTSYIKHCRTHLVEKSVKHQSRTLEKDLLPVWGDRAITAISRRDAIALLESVARRAPGQARNLLKNARAMFTFARHREQVEFNPFTDVSAAVPSIAQTSRDRVLTDDELKIVWHTLTDPDSYGFLEVKQALLLVLITAQRPGEVAGMHRREIDEEWWTIPKERTKYKTHPYRVYLSPLALRLIGDTSDFIFPAPIKEGPIDGNSLPSLVNKKYARSGKVPYFGLPRWTPHDLRRTAATKLSEELGAPDEVIDMILNHKKMGVTGIYNRNKYDKEKQKWMTKWADWLETLIKPKSAIKKKSAPKPAHKKGILKKSAVSG
jgi:integrase